MNVSLRDSKNNGRAGKLFSVLRDGEPKTRREIFERVGFMLTNNAASELRREVEPQGFGVAQWCVIQNGERAYVYQLVALPEPRLAFRGDGVRGSGSATASDAPQAGAAALRLIPAAPAPPQLSLEVGAKKPSWA